MLTPQQFRDIVSGRRRGISAALWRSFFSIAEYPYRWEVQRRNHHFDTGKSEIHRADVPVISVGNITMGGTGKTPTVEWLARWFRQRDVRVCLISRGYGAEEGSRNDEALELEQKLPDVPHVQNPDRVAAAKMAIEEFATQLIILDDAFQHRRIYRDLNIVLLDAIEPFGYDHVFPRGTLREPLAGLRRADIVALTRADMTDADQRFKIRGRVEQFHPEVPWVELTHAPQTLLSASGKQEVVKSLFQRPVAAFCGIGNPAGFRHTIECCDYIVKAWREFPDHHNFSREDVESLSKWAEDSDAQAIVCTQKDLVKLGVDELGGLPLWAISIGMEFVYGRESLEKHLEPLLVKIQEGTNSRADE